MWICQEKSPRNKHAKVVFTSTSFYGTNTTLQTWIFRAHSRIYPVLQRNILSFEDCCQKSHAKMTALLGLFPSFFPLSLPLSVFFSSFLSLPSPLPTLILPTSSADSLPPRLWPSKTEYPVLSGCHCLPAREYQWPAAQSNQFLRGRSTVCLTSGSLIIVSERKLINSNHHLASPSQKPWLLVFKVLPALSTAVCTPTPTETWIVASQWSWCSYFMNEVRRRGIISL